MIRKRKYVEDSPQYLIDLFENGKTAYPKSTLKKLLIINPEMKNVWQELSQKIKNEKDWDEIFQIICLAIIKGNQAHKYISRNDIQRKYVRFSEKLKKLSEEIEKDIYLDVRAYDFINNDILSIYGLRNMENLNSAIKAEKAGKVLTYWPPMSELLYDMSEKASKLALEAKNTPRSSDRNNTHLREREFVLSLGNSFKKMFDEYMFATTSTIAQSLFQNANCSIDKNFVISVLKKD